MKTNAKTACAIGAMLFGGTLGAARADVVALPGGSGGSTSWAHLQALNADPWAEGNTFRAEASGNPANAEVSFDDSHCGSFSLSRFGIGDFTLTRHPRIYTDNSATVDVYFRMGSNMDFSLTANLRGSTELSLTHFNANGEVLPDSIHLVGGGAVSLHGSLFTSTNGDYYGFRFFMPWTHDAGQETLFNLSFTPPTVPAPGAVALVGLVGLAGRRRRRQA
jgi:MYXO-CTERM domain-containing protein